MIRRLSIAAAFGVVAGLAFMALAAPKAAAQASRSSPMGAGNKLLIDSVSQIAGFQVQFGASTLVSAFENALQRSRDSARANSKPIPDEIRKALEPFYPDDVLAKVRYSVGDTTPAGLAGFAIRNGNAAAVTLIDTIVFKADEHVENLALWAHEIHHVEQYRDWGLSGFAEHYLFGWEAVEQEASDKADAFVTWYRKKTGQTQ